MEEARKKLHQLQLIEASPFNLHELAEAFSVSKRLTGKAKSLGSEHEIGGVII